MIREVPDVAAEEEAMALAIAEVLDPADGCLAALRKLTEKVNNAVKGGNFPSNPIIANLLAT